MTNKFYPNPNPKPNDNSNPNSNPNPSSSDPTRDSQEGCSQDACPPPPTQDASSQLKVPFSLKDIIFNEGDELKIDLSSLIERYNDLESKYRDLKYRYHDLSMKYHALEYDHDNLIKKKRRRFA